ncbi:hypothetical protein NCR96_09135 [Helicobacter sp. 14348-15]|uniref:hypothetical protein n=1 Tax=Helicobacter colisuis TaxID=2949739 RepID=UPI00202BA14A|nr:hypothetical protein [Helicobacter colisuis]MCL9821897.1 hypothetical protein [Helicobacter colisuis]
MDKKSFIISIVVWVLHIPFITTPYVMDSFLAHSNYKHPYVIVEINTAFFAAFLVLLLVFLSKAYLDSKYRQYIIYRIIATILANIAFFYAWLIAFVTNIIFYCDYYQSIDCADDPENSLCQNFPIEIDIGYLLYALPMLFMLSLALYNAFRNKVLTKINCIILMIYLIVNLVTILLHFRSNGVGCYD